MDNRKVTVTIEVFPDAVVMLRGMLDRIHARLRSGENPQQTASEMAMACGISMAMVGTIYSALPEGDLNG